MRARRTDDNQSEIVGAMRAAGASVNDTSMVGNGFPDTVVGICGLTALAEIKDGEKSPSRRKLNKKQIEFHATNKGWVAVLETVDDGLSLIHKMRETALCLKSQAP